MRRPSPSRRRSLISTSTSPPSRTRGPSTRSARRQQPRPHAPLAAAESALKSREEGGGDVAAIQVSKSIRALRQPFWWEKFDWYVLPARSRFALLSCCPSPMLPSGDLCAAEGSILGG